VRLYRAEALVDGDGSVRRDSAVLVDDDGAIVAVGDASAIEEPRAERVDVQVLMPGVVNAHTHLTDAEITEPIPGGDGLNAWVRRLLAARDRRPDPVRATNDGEPRSDNGPRQSISLEAVAGVLRAMREAGTSAIAEVSNGTGTLDAVLRSGMRATYIQEVLAFAEPRAEPALRLAIEIEESSRWDDEVRPTIGIHAPYSVSPALATMIVRHNRSRGRMTFEHMTEDPAERELYVHGSGPWRDYLAQVGAWDASWRPPGVAPLALYDELGLLGPFLALVHLADATPEEVALVARTGTRVILSPTSNLHIGDRLPPLEEIVRHGISFALGTDGRGSNPSIDVFDEARLLLERFAWLDARVLVRALTINGADVLGFREIGRIAPGMRPGLVGVELARLDGGAAEIARRIIAEPISRRRLD
jgi:cytosine/adenosine deaminase-related metal-dependent hydrolase